MGGVAIGLRRILPDHPLSGSLPVPVATRAAARINI